MNVPSFSPQPAAGSSRSASAAVSVEWYMSCTTRKSSFARISPQLALVDPRMGRVGGDDPEAADRPGLDAVDDPVVRPARSSGNALLGNVEQRGDRSTIGGVREIATTQQVGRVREQSRAHRVALAGDRVGPGPRPADAAGQERQVDRRLGRLHPLMALVHPHRPPERDSLGPRDPPGGVDDRLGVEPGLARHDRRVEAADERGEFVEAARVDDR